MYLSTWVYASWGHPSSCPSVPSVTFWGSLVAFAKLQELKSFKKPISYPGQQPINALLAAIILLVTIGFVAWSGHVGLYVLLVLLASVLGVLLVNPIGGADMPVVIPAEFLFGTCGCGHRIRDR